MLTVYKASAGSGKTYTLTKLYLRDLLGVKNGSGKYRLARARNRHRHILAITFTNKATEEMKSRIIGQLSILANDTRSSDYLSFFTTEFGCSEAELSRAAAQALEDLLLGYADFNVSTIDAFFQTVLRAMAYELDYPGDYELVLDPGQVLSQAASLMLDKVDGYADPELKSPVANVILNHMMEKLRKGESFNVMNRKSSVFRQLVRDAGTVFNEKFQQIARPVLAWLDREDAVDSFEKELKARMDSLTQDISRAAARYADIFSAHDADPVKNSHTSLKSSIARALTGQPPTTSALAGTLKKNFADAEFPKESLFSPKTVAARILPAFSDAEFARAMECVHTIITAGTQLSDVQLIRKSLPVYRFMKVLMSSIEEVETGNNIIVLSDTNRLLETVMDSGNVPFVYEKLGTRLNHFLIDEFQDTSRMQWRNLFPLVDNGLAQGYDSLIIGDEKQSIYRFRNSDSTLLSTTVPAQFPDKVTIQGNAPEQNTNWRSSEVVVKFNNTLFASLARTLNVSTYGNVRQEVAPKHRGEAGYVRFFPTPAAREMPAESADADPVVVPLSKEERLEAQIQDIVEQIKRQHNAGYRWRDIAVLSATKNGLKTVAEKLLAEGIPVATTEGLLVSRNIAVQTVLSTLRMLAQVRGATPVMPDNIDRATFTAHFQYVYSELVNGGENPDNAAVTAINNILDEYARLRARAHGSSGSSAPCDGSPDAPVTIRGAVADLVDERPATLTSLVELVIMHRLNETQRSRCMAFLAAFHDAVLQFSSTFGNNLVDFLRWWPSVAATLSISTPEDSDAVRFTTIHKAKGLQYPCVHISDGDYPLKGRNNKAEKIWKSAEGLDFANAPEYLLAELTKDAALPGSFFCPDAAASELAKITDGLNRVYVAYTRAERELCVYFRPEQDFGIELTTALMEMPGFVADNSSFVAGAPTVPLPTTKEQEHRRQMQAQSTYRLEDYVVTDPDSVRVYTRIDSDVATDVNGVDDAPALAPVNASLTGHCSLQDASREENAADTDRSPAAVRGTAMHFAMSCLNGHPGADLARQMETGIRRARRRGLTDPDADRLRNLLSDPVIAPALKRWYAHSMRAVTELPILRPLSADQTDLFITDDRGVLRPDLIVWHTPDDIEVVDFKFTSAVQDKHIQQVRDYATHLQQVFPQAHISATLLYADLRKIVTVIP